jgi:hypothetical protein
MLNDKKCAARMQAKGCSLIDLSYFLTYQAYILSQALSLSLSFPLHTGKHLT